MGITVWPIFRGSAARACSGVSSLDSFFYRIDSTDSLLANQAGCRSPNDA